MGYTHRNCGSPAGSGREGQSVVDVSEGPMKAAEVRLWLKPDGFSVGREEGPTEPSVQRQGRMQCLQAHGGPGVSIKQLRNGYTFRQKERMNIDSASTNYFTSWLTLYSAFAFPKELFVICFFESSLCYLWNYYQTCHWWNTLGKVIRRTHLNQSEFVAVTCLVILHWAASNWLLYYIYIWLIHPKHLFSEICIILL